MTSFLYYTDELYLAADSRKMDPGLKQEFMQRAAGCMDFSQVPPSLQKDVAFEAVLLLREILDRIELPDMAEIPGNDKPGQADSRAWTIPRTEITLARDIQGFMKNISILQDP